MNKLSEGKLTQAKWKTINIIEQHCNLVRECIETFTNFLHRRGAIHDNSKYYEDEFEGFTYFNTIDPNLVYNSPGYKEAMEKIRPYTKKAIKLHYSRNSHHPEYHDNIEDMSLLDLIEMVCDWKSASYTYNSSIKDPIDKNKLFVKNVNTLKVKYKFTDAQLWVIDEVIKVLNTEASTLEEPLNLKIKEKENEKKE